MRSLVSWRGTSTHHAPRARSAAAVGAYGRTRHAAGAPESRAWRPAGSLPYMPGLDGLRALAVIAVLLYHGGLTWLPGGFLGVEVFFVISGYLIDSLLLAEWRQQGRINLKAFWLGRARRLLPALYLLLAVTLAFAVVFLPDEVARLRADAIAAFGYVTNWYLAFGHQSYFETVGRPSLLQHLWSLAIEEQFYVLWPLVFAVGMGTKSARSRRRGLLVAVLAGSAGSALLMAILYQPGVDPSRIYYGNDTRAAGLLVGVALAFVWAPGRFFTQKHLRRALRHRTGRRPAPLLPDMLGFAALGGFVWFCLRLDETQPFLFRGGFALVALATAVVIMVVVHPRAYLGPSLLGGAAVALGRAAFVRHLPLALARFHGHPTPARRVPRRFAVAGPAAGGDGRPRGSLLSLRRNPDPQGCTRTGLEGVARGAGGTALAARRRMARDRRSRRRVLRGARPGRGTRPTAKPALQPLHGDDPYRRGLERHSRDQRSDIRGCSCQNARR